MPDRSTTSTKSPACRQRAQGSGLYSGDGSLGTSSSRIVGFVRIEKNLTSLGFFSPSNKRIPGTREKTVCFNRKCDGQRVEVRARILPSAAYGLPITSDQDKYLALMKIVNDLRKRGGEVTNPVGFTSAALLRILGLRVTAGKNYDDIVEWARRMTLTGICSEGVVYFAGRKTWASDTFHVFERFVSVGNQMPDGRVADRNYVWLSEWQLENVNHNHLLPIDLECYKQLKNHIAKALVPLLQIWLYASREGGCFEKRYEDLCQVLNIRQYRHLSKIREKVGPSLDELTKHEYLDGWKIQLAKGAAGFKVVFYHGSKFPRNQTRREAQASNSLPDEQSVAAAEANQESRLNQEYLHQLMRRGISEKASIELLRNLHHDQELIDQLEWGDYLLGRAPKSRFYNPAGLYIHLIKENVMPSNAFESSRRRQLREAATQAEEEREQELARLELGYLEYRRESVDRFIQDSYTVQEFSALVQTKKQELLKQDRWKRYLALNGETQKAALESLVKAEIAKRLPLIPFSEYRQRQASREDQIPESLLDLGSPREAIPPLGLRRKSLIIAEYPKT